MDLAEFWKRGIRAILNAAADGVELGWFDRYPDLHSYNDSASVSGQWEAVSGKSRIYGILFVTDSKSGFRKDVGVGVPPPAPIAFLEHRRAPRPRAALRVSALSQGGLRHGRTSAAPPRDRRRSADGGGPAVETLRGRDPVRHPSKTGVIGAMPPPPESALSIASVLDYATPELASPPAEGRQTLVIIWTRKRAE